MLSLHISSYSKYLKMKTYKQSELSYNIFFFVKLVKFLTKCQLVIISLEYWRNSFL